MPPSSPEAREARPPIGMRPSEISVAEEGLLEDWEAREMLRMLLEGKQLEAKYVAVLAEYVADRVLRDERLRKRFVKGDYSSKIEYVASDSEAYSEAMAQVAELLREAGLNFVTLPIGRNDYRVYYAEKCVLVEGADARLLKIMGVLYGANRRGRVPLARNLLMQVGEVLMWEDINPGGYIPLADGRVLDLEDLKLKEEAGRYFTAKAGVALEEGDLNMLRSWLGKYDWEEGEELILNMAPNYALAYRNVFNTPELRAQAREMLGAIFFDGQLRKAWIVLGEPGIGKSVIADALRWALGELASSLSLSRLFGQENRLVTGELAGKYANITCERPTQMLRALDFFKQLTGDEVLWGEVKYARPFRFRNRCKLLVFTDRLPMFSEIDDATLDRLYIIASEGERPEKPDPYLRRKIRERELKYVFLHMLWCYLELKERDFKLIGAPDREEVAKLLVSDYSDISDFIDARCELGEEFREQGSKLYDAYLEWCGTTGRRPLGRNTFYGQLVSLGFKKLNYRGAVWFKGLRLMREEESHLFSL